MGAGFWGILPIPGWICCRNVEQLHKVTQCHMARDHPRLAFPLLIVPTSSPNRAITSGLFTGIIQWIIPDNVDAHENPSWGTDHWEREKGEKRKKNYQIPVINYSLQIIHPALVNTLLCFFTDRSGLWFRFSLSAAACRVCLKRVTQMSQAWFIYILGSCCEKNPYMMSNII